MKHKPMRRILAGLLAGMLCLSMTPGAAFAEDATGADPQAPEAVTAAATPETATPETALSPEAQAFVDAVNALDRESILAAVRQWAIASAAWQADPDNAELEASLNEAIAASDKAVAPVYAAEDLYYGEWCEPGVTPMQAMANPRKSVGTAYLAYSGRLLAEIAAVLGRQEEAEIYRATADKAVKAYRTAFTEDGVIHSDRQCEYVRAIAFALLGEEESRAAAATLNQMVVDNGCHLNTGFLSTPFLCGVLAQYGYIDTAYHLLLQPEAPGWLYEVNQGANTLWETWTGIDAEGKPHESLNHYSYGAICGWLFRGVCGIHFADGQLTIAPIPHKTLGYAKAVYDSPAGRIESGWRYEGDTVAYEFTIPTNITAHIHLPDGRTRMLSAGTHRL